MPPAYRIISIGTLPAHPLWEERGEVRTGHATTTLISVGDQHVLVDPSLPPQMLLARMSERTNVRPEQVTQVFLTSFDPGRRRALPAFGHADWLMHEPEREASGAKLQELLERAEDADEPDLEAHVREQMELLSGFSDAEDSMLPGVDLFPLPGVTPGLCGLLIGLPSATVLITGDAVPTVEHLERGMILPEAANLEQAQESFREAVEIADALVLGRDNVVFNPARRLM